MIYQTLGALADVLPRISVPTPILPPSNKQKKKVNRLGMAATSVATMAPICFHGVMCAAESGAWCAPPPEYSLLSVGWGPL